MRRREVITSSQNALVKRARAVRDGRQRDSILVEGVRLCEEALRAGLSFEAVLTTEAAVGDARTSALLAALEAKGAPVSLVSATLLDAVSDTKTPQGIVALARRPQTQGRALPSDGKSAPLVVVLHRLNNPSNAGALLRAAEAAGATGAIATEGTADIFSPKALRGAMGSTFRLPLWTGATFAEVVEWCAARGVETVATDADATRLHTELDWTLPRAVIVGTEGGGLSAEETAAADVCVKIPMREPVESLNAAVALAVVLYEAARQRGWPR
ncbi:MAG TPA: RNA methyltransferase [Pyrinomonadaceae bacterium]|nr:RNA methyltransferase [Pyrinomonadaceae bacterium]